MPLQSAPRATRTIPFLDMPVWTGPDDEIRRHFLVRGIFASYRSHLGDYQAEALTERLKRKFPHYGHDAISNYAVVLTYTQDLYFDWLPETGEDLKALEPWWQSVKKGAHEETLFEEYTTMNAIIMYGHASSIHAERRISGWLSAFIEAVNIWTPLTTRPFNQLTAEEANDPN